MILEYFLNSKLKELRNSNMKEFDDKINKAMKHIYPSLEFRIIDNNSKILVQGVPVIYVDSIKNTLEEIFKNYSSNESNSYNNLYNDSLIDLMFNSFSIEKKYRQSFLNKISNIKIEYNEDLFFYSNKHVNNSSRLKMLYKNNDRYFYKIKFNSRLHKKSSLKIFNNVIKSDNKDISIINNPSTLFKFHLKLDHDLDIIKKVMKIYTKTDISEFLPEKDRAHYDKYFKYITFLSNKSKNKELEDKKDIHKQIELGKNNMFNELKITEIN